jgi:ABC-2 type transport system permease protein
LPLAFGFMVLSALLFTALGIAIACLVSNFQAFQFVTNFILQPMFLLSGALYPLNRIAKGLLWAARVDPLAYGVDGIRGILVRGSSHFGLPTDIIFLTTVTVVLLSAGIYLFSKVRS